MTEFADTGVPANGPPSAEGIERERTRWDDGRTVREGLYETALTLREPTTVVAAADRTPDRLCDRVRPQAPALVRRDRDRRTGRRWTARTLPAQRRVLRVEASGSTPTGTFENRTRRTTRPTSRTRSHLPGALRRPRPGRHERARSRRPRLSRRVRERSEGDRRLAERSRGDPSHRTGSAASARSFRAGLTVRHGCADRRCDPPVDRRTFPHGRARRGVRLALGDAAGQQRPTVTLDPGRYPDRVANACIEVQWDGNDAFTIHYVETHAEGGTWRWRWDRQRNPHNEREHFHRSPDAADPIDVEYPEDYRDVLSAIRIVVRDRIETLWNRQNG